MCIATVSIHFKQKDLKAHFYSKKYLLKKNAYITNKRFRWFKNA